MKPRKVVDPKYNEFHKHMLTVFRIHASTFTAQEMLVVASQLVGQLMAIQDQSIPNCRDVAIACVMENIELGNASAIETALNLPTMGNA